LSVAIETANSTVAVDVATQAEVSADYAKHGHTGLTVTVTTPARGA
jgi:hypothetical protein